MMSTYHIILIVLFVIFYVVSIVFCIRTYKQLGGNKINLTIFLLFFAMTWISLVLLFSNGGYVRGQIDALKGIQTFEIVIEEKSDTTYVRK